MSATITDLEQHEVRAEGVLKQVGVLDPDPLPPGVGCPPNVQELRQLVTAAVEGLEELWTKLAGALQSGISLADAVLLARTLTRTVNLIGSAVDLLTLKGLAPEEFRVAHQKRLQRFRAHAASLRRLAEMPAPVPDPERLQRSLEQMRRGEGIDAETLLSEFKA
jgi:hypothetical protein